MTRRLIGLTLLASVALGLSLGLQAQSAQRPSSCNITTTGRVVAIADVHGALDKYVAILREAQLIDSRRRWIGGNAVLVQLGDVLDRGSASRQALDLIRRLEGDAARAGGGVLFLLGNHELMRMAGEYKDVSTAEYDAFKTDQSSDLRERLYQHVLTENIAKARARGETFDAKEFRKRFLAEVPLGSVEMQMAFSDTGDYGHWLREHDIMARVNGMVFVHGGPSAAFAAAGCDGTNARARKEMQSMNLADPEQLKNSLWSPDGPLWYRGLALDPPGAASADDVTAILAGLGASSIVVGHTVSPTRRIRSLFDGRVFQLDTGMLNGEFFPGGAASALEIQNGKFTAIYEGKREVLR